MGTVDLLCSRNAWSRTPLVGRAQWEINQFPFPGGKQRGRESLLERVTRARKALPGYRLPGGRKGDRLLNRNPPRQSRRLTHRPHAAFYRSAPQPFPSLCSSPDAIANVNRVQCADYSLLPNTPQLPAGSFISRCLMLWRSHGGISTTRVRKR
jgi:hypothetical protein